MEIDNPYDQNNHNAIKHTENLMQFEEHLDKINIVSKEVNILNHAFSDINNLIDATENKIVTSETTEKNFSTLGNCVEYTLLYENDDKDTVHSHLQPNSQFVENNGKYNLNIVTSNGPSTVQKEHLLEMASEVANVLTDTDHSDPSLFDIDLKCRNQFLTTCLEEQKQLVNDLHVQVNRYVSII